MKRERNILRSLATALSAVFVYILFAALLCTLAGCAPTGLEDTPQSDPLPMASQALAVSQSPEAEPVELSVREVPLAAGFEDYYAIRSDGTLVMWGQTEFGGFEEPIPFENAVELLPNAAAVYTSGRGATLAVDKDGGLWAFNTTQFNELIPGVNVDFDKDRMKPVKLMDGVAMAAMGQFHTLILMRDGTLWVKGFASFGAPWLGQMGAYLTKAMDDVIWVDLTSYGGYAVTSDHELWGWGFSHNEPQPEKLLDGVIQAASGHLALTPQGELLNWRYDYETQTLTQPEVVFQHVTQFGCNFAITEDGTLWVCNVGTSINTAEKMMEHIAYAVQGELGILALDQDGGLWLLRPDFDRGIYEKTKLS